MINIQVSSTRSLRGYFSSLSKEKNEQFERVLFQPPDK
jgi:hypothetical protein